MYRVPSSMYPDFFTGVSVIVFLEGNPSCVESTLLAVLGEEDITHAHAASYNNWKMSYLFLRAI